jgi:non-heme chloroperoxidase
MPVLERLPGSIRAIAVSQRGHGESDKPASGYRVEDFAADLVALLDRLGVERAVIAGHSASCLVARRTAIDHPTRVAGLVLEASPTTLRGHEGLENFVDSIVSGLEDPIELFFARSFVADTSSAAVAPELLAELARETMKVPARVWKHMFAELLRYTDMAELERIDAPTLLVWGDADPIVTSDMQHVLAGRIRGIDLVTYPGVGHAPRWEDPVRFAADITAFVERDHERS